MKWVTCDPTVDTFSNPISTKLTVICSGFSPHNNRMVIVWADFASFAPRTKPIFIYRLIGHFARFYPLCT